MQKQSSLQNVVQSLGTLLAVLVATGLTSADAMAQDQKPNLVIFYADDLGYADIGSFGAEGYETPNLDRMADEGRKFTSFYVSQAVCGASRASLLTGCYANRVSLPGAPNHTAKHGVHADEVLLPELLREHGYATGMAGKWHLGHRQQFLPLQNGFDEWLGLPYSNDMWPYHPTSKIYPPLPLFDGNDVVNANVTGDDQKQLTTQYTERAVDFIQRNAEQPFFLYVAYAMPHVPLFVSKKFDGKSENGLYGDVIMEIDWSVGQVLEELKTQGVDENTLVIFTSDNGPWLAYGNHAGSAGPLREGKATTWEGGVRVPCVMRWPGTIPAGTTCDELATTMDILPTMANLIGASLPDHPIDGENILPLMTDENAETPHDVFYYYWGDHLQAIRAGKWKLHFPHDYRGLTGTAGQDGLPGGYSKQETGLALYNLEADLSETTDVKDQHSDVVEELQQLAEVARERLGDSAENREGSEVRPAGKWNGK